MLKRAVAISLIFFTITANFSKLYIYAGFEMNRSYIATNLCENKAKPWLHCNGRCVLMKRIKQAEEREKNEERQAAKSYIQEAFCESRMNMVFNNHLLQVIVTPYPDFVLSNRRSTIFRPPQVLV